jgi:hypothetical protein
VPSLPRPIDAFDRGLKDKSALDERRFTDPTGKLSSQWSQAAILRIEAAESRIRSRSPGDESSGFSGLS